MELAASRALVVQATTASENQQTGHTRLLVKRSELQATAAAALSDHRAGKIDEPTAALRKSVAEADLADLEVMIQASADKLRDLNVALAAVRADCAQCEKDAKLEENSMALLAMQKIVAANQEAYLASVAELHRVWVLCNPKDMAKGSIWKSHQPSDELRAMVVKNTIPNLRG
jgi:hypothetical protein